MKRLLLSIIISAISISFNYGNTWKIINEKTWIAKKDFPTYQFVFYESVNGLKKAIFQINGSGRCAVLSFIYDVVLKEDTIYLKNELNLDSLTENKGDKTKASLTLYLKNDSTIISNNLSIEYGKAFNDARICNWIEKYSGYQIMPIQALKAIPIGENQIYNINSFNLGPNPEDCGIDNNPNLTEVEATFLNEYLKGPVYEKKFDFSKKRIVFATGNNGGILGSKRDFFNNVKEWKEKYNNRIVTSLIVLNETEKLEYGYDAIVTYWVKVLTPRTTKRLLEKTKEIK